MRSLFLSFFLILFVGSINISAQNQNNDNEKIKDLISKKRAYNKSFGFGYRIQIYNGSEKRAKSIRSRFEIEFPEVFSRLKYNAPEWKVQVGKYKTKLEADKALILFQKEFSGIIVVPMGR